MRLRLAHIVVLAGAALFLLGPVVSAAQPSPLPTRPGQAALVGSRNSGPGYVPGHLVVKFRQDALAPVRASVKSAHRLESLNQIGNTGAELMHVAPGDEQAT